MAEARTWSRPRPSLRRPRRQVWGSGHRQNNPAGRRWPASTRFDLASAVYASRAWVGWRASSGSTSLLAVAAIGDGSGSSVVALVPAWRSGLAPHWSPHMSRLEVWTMGGASLTVSSTARGSATSTPIRTAQACNETVLASVTVHGNLYRVSKVRRRGYVFLTWKGDHSPI